MEHRPHTHVHTHLLTHLSLYTPSVQASPPPVPADVPPAQQPAIMAQRLAQEMVLLHGKALALQELVDAWRAAVDMVCLCGVFLCERATVMSTTRKGVDLVQ